MVFRGAEKKFAHHFPKIFPAEWSTEFCLPPVEERGLLSVMWSTCSLFLEFLLLDVRVGRSLNVSWLCFLEKGLPKRREGACSLWGKPLCE